jgi:hypothetical protein
MERIPEDRELKRGEIPPRCGGAPVSAPNWTPEELRASSAEWLAPEDSAEETGASSRRPKPFLEGMAEAFGSLIDVCPPAKERHLSSPRSTPEEMIQEAWRAVGRGLFAACAAGRVPSEAKPDDQT